MIFSELATAVRMLSIDAVEAAQSGHPGMPLGMADIATVLWTKFLRHNPKNPRWFNRDRFVLSNGHGSALLYALLHLSGYALSLEELKNFRQLHSKTPGHPEINETPGVETTTGPLAQGLANAVGMAIAEKVLARRFNSKQRAIVDHYTYVFAGDGCLMEGLSHEVCSLAGTQALGKLIVFYDDNAISIDGNVGGWFTDNTQQRFQAYNWHVIDAVDGHDSAAIENAIHKAQHVRNQPSLIICKTIIGFASPVAGSEKSHGAPLGKEAVAQVRAELQWPHPPFEIPAELYQHWDNCAQGQAEENNWLNVCQQYQQADAESYSQFLRQINGDLPDNWEQLSQGLIERCTAQTQPMATRKSSQFCIEYFAQFLPELLGGSADLSGSNNTNWSGTKAISAEDCAGNYINYGVREFGMAAIMNGIAVHGGFIPYGGTFLVFADYARNAIRLSALMQQRVIYILTHDSIGLGEDGPTHQPIEHAAMLRLTPNLTVWRPADLLETAVAWQHALSCHNGPSALLLSRQNLTPLPPVANPQDLISKGAYCVLDCEGVPDVIIIATGSEVHIALDAINGCSLTRKVRLVSMPCPELFLQQEADYQQALLPDGVRNRIALEAGATNYWYRFVGLDGKVIGIDRFGVSASATDAYTYLGITVEAVVKAINSF